MPAAVKTNDEQVDLLASLGMVIGDRDAASNQRQHINYYRPSEYWYSFRRQGTSDREDAFYPGSTTNQAWEQVPETGSGNGRDGAGQITERVPRAKYRRIKSRRGKMRALVAVEHSVLIAIWHMLRTGECYVDLGRITTRNASRCAAKTAASTS